MRTRRGRTRAAVTAAAAAVLTGPLLAAPASAAPFLDPGAVCSTPAPPAPVTDRDRVPALHLPALDCAFARGITVGRSGPGGVAFNPAAPVPRDQMASFLVRTLVAAGVDVPAPSGQPFDDIGGNVHADAIRQLAQLGITTGTAQPRRYAPAQPVTRAQMASYLVRTANVAFGGDDLAAGATGAVRFPDVAEGDVHRPAIQAAAELLELTQGRADGTYGPTAPTSRAQMVTFVVRLLDLVEEPQP